ncbi:MAG: DUF366 family protein [Candidatus Heimdallarchaeota archaeon]|nr:DUF366 family protein [Candidatus Heimdallarchaeota archaeon]MCK4954921.1 DUF366 family protein [Candidatus Heimdallarchaeota archaeon]
MKITKKAMYNIIVENLMNPITYDGSQIASQYTSQNYDVIGNSILVFRGSMRLSPNEMIDIKDIQRESHLNEILISSDDSLHFIIEEFDIQPPNLEIEYYRLRLLTQIVIEILQSKGIEGRRKGTDIYIEERKLNVGIASVGISSSKIHFGINIGSTGFPSHVKAIGLLELGLEEEEIKKWSIQIPELYIEEIQRVKEDIVKTKALQ